MLIIKPDKNLNGLEENSLVLQNSAVTDINSVGMLLSLLEFIVANLLYLVLNVINSGLSKAADGDGGAPLPQPVQKLGYNSQNINSISLQ